MTAPHLLTVRSSAFTNREKLGRVLFAERASLFCEVPAYLPGRLSGWDKGIPRGSRAPCLLREKILLPPFPR